MKIKMFVKNLASKDIKLNLQTTKGLVLMTLLYLTVATPGRSLKHLIVKVRCQVGLFGADPITLEMTNDCGIHYNSLLMKDEVLNGTFRMDDSKSVA